MMGFLAAFAIGGRMNDEKQQIPDWLVYLLLVLGLVFLVLVLARPLDHVQLTF